jgi:hypothetical protein
MKPPFNMKQKKILFKEMELHKKVAQENTFIEQTLESIARHFGLEDDFTHIKTRKREYVYARQICMFLIKKHTKRSLASIGELFGDKDHATVLHAVKTIFNLAQTSKEIKNEVLELEELIMCKMKILLDKSSGENDFYYINFDNYNSIRFNDDKGMVLTGFSELEIFRFLTFLQADTIEVRKHKNTGYYILEK